MVRYGEGKRTGMGGGDMRQRGDDREHKRDSRVKWGRGAVGRQGDVHHAGCVCVCALWVIDA